MGHVQHLYDQTRVPASGQSLGGYVYSYTVGKLWLDVSCAPRRSLQIIYIKREMADLKNDGDWKLRIVAYLPVSIVILSITDDL